MNDVHTTHCCPVHGCKYAENDCSVLAGAPPAYSNNNGCEICDFIASED